MPTTNTAETVSHIDGTERPIDPSLLDFLREQTRATIIERREKLGNGTGGAQEREELAVLYPQALTLGLDPLTLEPIETVPHVPESERTAWQRALWSATELLMWGRREAGLVG